MENKIRKIEDYAKSLRIKKFAHGFDHTDRVRKWILKIAKAEKYPNRDLAEAAALLHDIGRSNPKKGEHGKVGAEMAEKFLSENKLFTNKEIKEIGNAIRYHSKNREGEGNLLDMLRDADILDLLGAIGILRGGMSESQLKIFDPKKIKGETWGMDVNDFNQRFDCGVGKGSTMSDQINFQISCYGNIKSDYAKKMAGQMVKVMQEFLSQVEKEAKQDGL